ncbi:MAG: NAD(P)-dependent oxidoreductase [Aestuariivita sp.]|nr:NAD(P)-dependent oxidoreductase [Aestuariivita sp.]
MKPGSIASGISRARLSLEELHQNFADLHSPFNQHEAVVAADRCYFCYDAPCIAACPTTIDIPLFIRQIQTGQPENAAQTIFDQNILGGMCARVCPTETLCEEACVRHMAEERPVEIGRLQRYATDRVMQSGVHPYIRATHTNKHIAVVGAGPAGLACAHRLALKGHDVHIMEQKPKAGGLNEYGIAAYKTVDDFAATEVDWLMQIGGIQLTTDCMMGRDVFLDDLLKDYDAVFLSIGLGGVNALPIQGESKDGSVNAVDFIARLRQIDDLTKLPIGRNVVVIGGGMTAVDAAVQAKLLGAEHVTIAYRRAREAMSASRYEQDLATSRGVRLMFNVQPVAVYGNDRVAAVEFEYMQTDDHQLRGTGETFQIEVDQVFKAIGQNLFDVPVNVAVTDGKIDVTDTGRTNVPNLWAGGDCARGGDDLTVTAVAAGRDAAEDIHAVLMVSGCS